MEIITTNEHCIITPLTPKINSGDIQRLNAEINTIKGKKIGLDLRYVKDCTADFLNELKNWGNIGLFNIHSDIFTALSFMNLDKVLKIYVSELDFVENKRQILNRNLRVLG